MELFIPAWEWDSGVGVIFGAPVKTALVKNSIQMREDGKMREWTRYVWWFRFRNGFRLELWMDAEYQDKIVPAVHWPQGNQVDYNTWKSPIELLDLLNQVMGQQGLTA